MSVAKLENGQLVYPTGNVIIIANPREEDYKRLGYKDVEDNRPEEQEGKVLVPEYTETEDKIVINYHYEDVPTESEEEVDDNAE